MLDTYFTNDESNTKLSLLRKIYEFDNNTCMQIASVSKCLNFIAHPCFQNVLVKIWYNIVLPDNCIPSVRLHFLIKYNLL